MFGSYLSAAIGNLLRNKLHAAINLFGLALGLATAILIGLYVRDEVTFERFLPGYQQVYRFQSISVGADGRRFVYASTPHTLAGLLRENYPELAEITRMMGGEYGLRRGDVEAVERIQSADPNFFAVLGYPLVAGDPARALATPDSIALSRAMALKYFGTVDCVGQTLELDRRTVLRVGGVFEDLPSNTHLYGLKLLLSSLVPESALAKADLQPPPPDGEYDTDSNTYVRLKPGASLAEVNARLPDFMRAHYPDSTSASPPSGFLAPIASIHLHGRELGDFVSGSDLATVYAISATGLLVLIVAGINFVNLVTARATRRAMEVGVRKAAGATRGQLIAQFMGESIAYAFVALILAMALVELVLPGFNGFLDRTIGFPYWRDPLLLLSLPTLALVIGLLAGCYPALVLSSFRPAAVLKGAVAAQGSGNLRQVLVVLQYAISIALLIATAVIYRQTQYATDGSLNFDKDQIVTVALGGLPGARSADGSHFVYDRAAVDHLRDRFAALPGVKAVADSWVIPNAQSQSSTTWRIAAPSGTRSVAAGRVTQGFGFFEVYGIHPIAGRSFSRDHGEDDAPEDENVTGTAIINATAVRAFGYASPAAAIGQEVGMELGSRVQYRRIVGVVPDFPLQTIRTRIPPNVFLLEPDWSNYLNIKLSGEHIPETLAAIDRIWRETVTSRPISRQFIDDRIELLYRDITRQGEVFAGFALVAVLIACLGLFGLAAFTAERRTKEIGIRKAMGASTRDILKLLVWEFAKPVLLANVVAWPLAYAVMGRWLDGFAYRIALDPLMFVGAGVAALVIASGTTLYHALQVARSRPVLALRYE